MSDPIDEMFGKHSQKWKPQRATPAETVAKSLREGETHDSICSRNTIIRKASSELRRTDQNGRHNDSRSE